MAPGESTPYSLSLVKHGKDWMFCVVLKVLYLYIYGKLVNFAKYL